MEFGARKEGTQEYITLATLKQYERMKTEGVDFNDTVVYLDDFNHILNFLREEDKKNTKMIKDFLKKETKTLVFKYGTEKDIDTNIDTIFTSKNFIWSIEDCENGWYIVVATMD